MYSYCVEHNELISFGCRCSKCRSRDELFGIDKNQATIDISNIIKEMKIDLSKNH